jgi:hypothetical protein
MVDDAVSKIRGMNLARFGMIDNKGNSAVGQPSYEFRVVSL